MIPPAMAPAELRMFVLPFVLLFSLPDVLLCMLLVLVEVLYVEYGCDDASFTSVEVDRSIEEVGRRDVVFKVIVKFPMSEEVGKVDISLVAGLCRELELVVPGDELVLDGVCV